MVRERRQTGQTDRRGVLSVGAGSSCFLLLLCVGLMAGSGVLAGCEKDPFAEAPSAQAPEPGSERAEAEQPARQQAAGDRGKPGAGSDIPKSGELPEGHPPVAAQLEKNGNNGAGGAAPSGGGGGGRQVPVQWTTPEGWQSVRPASQMRLAQFRAPGPEGAPPATMAVFHFRGGGGGVQKNIERWVGQFQAPEGGSVQEQADIKKQQANGLTVHTVDVSGTFAAGRGMGSGKPRPNYRMLAAIVETGAGPVFFKMVGPEKTLGANTDEFEAFVKSLKPRS